MKRSPIFLIMAMAALGFGGLAYYVTSTPDAQRVPASIRKPEAPKPASGIRLPVINGEKVSLGSEVTPVSDKSAIPELLAKGAVRAAGADPDAVVHAEISNGTAVISLKKSMAGNFGSMQEATLIQAWQVAFGQLKEVRAIQIEVDGQPLDTLGHFEIDQPLLVIRDGSSADRPRP